jgi:hypothetical protein
MSDYASRMASGWYESPASSALAPHSFLAHKELSNGHDRTLDSFAGFGHQHSGVIGMPEAGGHEDGRSGGELVFTQDECTLFDILKLLTAETWQKDDPLWISCSAVQENFTSWEKERKHASLTIAKSAEGPSDTVYLNIIVDNVRALLDLYGQAINRRSKGGSENAKSLLDRCKRSCSCARERAQRLRAIAGKKEQEYFCRCDLKHQDIVTFDRSILTCAREMYEALKSFQLQARAAFQLIDANLE